jgi:hypothetical protein
MRLCSKGFGDHAGGFYLRPVSLPVIEAQGEELETVPFGDRKAGGRIQPAGNQHDRLPVFTCHGKSFR